METSERGLNPFEDEVVQAEAKPLASRFPEVPQANLDEKLPCGLSRREIYQMKKAGMMKPSFVTWAEWQGPKKLSHRHMLMAHLAAVGYRARDIAQATNITESRISLLLNSPIMKEQIKLIREVEMQGLGVAQKIDQLSSQAMRVYEDILFDPASRDSLKQKTAQDILDRKIGKPNIRVEHSGSLFKDFIQMLNQQKTIEASSRRITEDDLAPDMTDEELGLVAPAEPSSGEAAPSEATPKESKPEIPRPDAKGFFEKEKL